MRTVNVQITNAWHRGDFTGRDRPIVRLTVARLRSDTHHVAENTFYSSAIFSTSVRQREIPQESIQLFEWSRSVDSEIASASVRLSNVRIAQFTATDPEGDVETYQRHEPGIFTYNHGTARFASRWGHEPNEWNRFFMPDNIIRSYEGYGWDPSVCADKDPNLVRTGVWKIDTVNIAHDGTMNIECRDLGALLADHLIFPPVNPWEAGFKTKDMPDGAYAYPVSFRGQNPEPIVNEVPLDSTRLNARFHDSSNTYYYGQNEALYGHRPSDAFDTSTSSYWLSVGNARRDAGYAFEWIQASVPKTTVRQVKFRTRGTGYMAYLCVWADGKWQGKRNVAYDPTNPISFPNDSNTKYVVAMPVATEGEQTFTIPGGGIANATRVRLTFGNLWDSNLGPYQYRAAVRTFHVFGGPASKKVTTKINNKNINDYTDAVKLFCAWGGFYWPRVAYQRSCDDSLINMSPSRDDKAITIRAGRVWGDFEQTGTAPVVEIPASEFDKKSLLDCIVYIRDIVGYIFYVDENGGVVFRHPNIFQLGNLMRVSTASVGERTQDMWHLDETKHIMNISSTLSSRNMRERVFVSSTDGVHGAMSAGWNPNPSSMRRIAGWSDMHFESNEECQVMADLITLRQLFTYRSDRLTIPANPAIQVDDQVRIWERTTSEGFVHYVRGITSSNDQQSGEWTYELDTHWLGEDPFTRWAFDQKQLSKEAQTYVQKLFIPQTGET